MQELDDQLETLLDTWTRTLRSNLDDPITQNSLGLLPIARKQAVESFITSGILPQSIDTEVIKTFQEVLRGLTKVEIRKDNLAAALLEGGVPTTPAELERRFKEYLNKVIAGKDPSSVRIVIE